MEGHVNNTDISYRRQLNPVVHSRLHRVLFPYASACSLPSAPISDDNSPMEYSLLFLPMISSQGSLDNLGRTEIGVSCDPCHIHFLICVPHSSATDHLVTPPKQRNPEQVCNDPRRAPESPSVCYH